MQGRIIVTILAAASLTTSCGSGTSEPSHTAPPKAARAEPPAPTIADFRATLDEACRQTLQDVAQRSAGVDEAPAALAASVAAEREGMRTLRRLDVPPALEARYRSFLHATAERDRMTVRVARLVRAHRPIGEALAARRNRYATTAHRRAQALGSATCPYP
jgi:hypothetical protein